MQPFGRLLLLRTALIYYSSAASLEFLCSQLYARKRLCVSFLTISSLFASAETFSFWY